MGAVASTVWVTVAVSETISLVVGSLAVEVMVSVGATVATSVGVVGSTVAVSDAVVGVAAAATAAIVAMAVGVVADVEVGVDVAHPLPIANRNIKVITVQ
jgi:hypothetical protein